MGSQKLTKLKEEQSFYDYDKQYQIAINAFERDKSISEINKNFIRQFINNCFSEGLSKGRVCKYIYFLRRIGSLIDIDFDKATKPDMKRLVAKLEAITDISNVTKKDHKVAIKKFYKSVFGDGEDYPECVRFIKATLKNNHKIPDILTEDDFKLMLKTAKKSMDKCLLATLFDSGARIGEIASVQLKHIKFLEEDTIEMILPQSKTKPRRILLIPATPYIRIWLNDHPLKNDEEAYLFINSKNNQRLNYDAYLRRLQRIGKLAKINKRVNPHTWRKSSATWSAKMGLSDVQLDERYGWVIGSKTKQVYVHLSGRDSDFAYMKIHGKDVSKEKTENEIKPIRCSFCDHINGVDSKYCGKCLRPLNIKVALEQQQKREVSAEIEQTLIQDPRYKIILDMQTQILRERTEKDVEFKNKIKLFFE